MAAAAFDADYELDDRYRRRQGRVYLTGVQALVRLPLMQRQRDLAAGLDTAGFVSGYRGSPLGTYDMALWQAKDFLDAHRIRFEPGVNEDLAATAVWGSQQSGLYAGAKHDGVFGIWYGKGPGVDRSCDALKHANYAGTAPHGGVLALTGDDPGARSSSIAHQSEHALIHCGIPVLNPASVQEYLDFGLLGFALSRYAGCWVGMKCLTDSVDSARSVAVDADRIRAVEPDDFERPESGFHIGWGNLPLAVEQRLFQQRLPAARAFARANGVDRALWQPSRPRLGIVTAGKAYLDVREALEQLGIDAARAEEVGLSIYKVGMTWPLEPEGARRFAAGLEEILVVEEKRPLLEEQLAHLLYNLPERPRIVGKLDEQGAPLVPSEGELAPAAVAAALRSWLERRAPELARRLAPAVAVSAPTAPGPMRLPAFCSGCPHNGSTVVPEESVALGGIGCHGMAVWLPDRRTLAVTQMGGEGANWIGAAPFTETPHVFQNIGDGTYFHSGLLAIRAAVTAGVNITYKVLANGAVAMTGGQPIEGESLQGEVTVPEIARQLAAEGVGRIAVVSNEPDKYPRTAGFPAGVSFHHRDDIDVLQRELREHRGVSALIYDQTCAAEARRLRKRDAFPDPDRRIVINELVCEGCGDCSVQSNCISIEPVETELGRKRRINQSSCNKDYSCVKGYCPSFVSVYGGALRKAGPAGRAASGTRAEIDSKAGAAGRAASETRAEIGSKAGAAGRAASGTRAELDEVAGGAGVDAGSDEAFAVLPSPPVADTSRPFNVLVAGIGGSGVVTVGALLGMAAHLEGKGCSVLDVTGLAQKNGPVTSHVRIAADPDALHATRIGAGGTDLLVGADIVVAASAQVLPALSSERTTAVVDTRVAPTFEFATNPDLDLSSRPMEQAIAAGTREKDAHFVAAGPLATALLGDAIATNLILVGYALQKGRLPVGLPALERAIELNGRAVALNKRALAWGRLAAHDLDAVERVARPALRDERTQAPPSLEELVERRMDFLEGYQSARYARRYRALVDRVAQREGALGGGTPLAEAVARYYFKLLAYKDEYEVARLYSDGSFRRQLATEFEGDYRLELHLSPQFLRRDPATGRVRKIAVGPWIFPLFRVLAKLKPLRGTPLDPFGRTAHRRLERQLIADYEATVETLLEGLGTESRALAVEIASLPEQIRGFDVVKERHLETVRQKQAQLLAAFADVA